VQRVLGHATAAMTMDLYGHLAVGGILGAPEPTGGLDETDDESEPDENAWL
jgi:hypothetical protein